MGHCLYECTSSLVDRHFLQGHAKKCKHAVVLRALNYRFGGIIFQCDGGLNPRKKVREAFLRKWVSREET